MNKRSIFLLTSFIAAIFCNTNAYAEKVIAGTRGMPLEVNLLVDGLQDTPENFDKILPIVKNIDLYARSMTKEDIFLIGKIEVYKTLLKNYDAPIKLPINSISIATLKLAISKTNDNFLKWFLQALLKDSQDLIEKPAYKELLLQRNSNMKFDKNEYRKLEKKAELLQYWISKVSPDSEGFPDSLRNELTPKMLLALNNIQNSFRLMAEEASAIPIGSPLKNEADLKFFTVKNTTSPAKKTVPTAPKQKTVEDILSPVIASPPQDLPLPTQENWLEDENTPPSLQNLPKPSNDAEWLQDF